MFEADRKRAVAFYTDAVLGWYPDWVDGEMFNVGTESKEV